MSESRPRGERPEGGEAKQLIAHALESLQRPGQKNLSEAELKSAIGDASTEAATSRNVGSLE